MNCPIKIDFLDYFLRVHKKKLRRTFVPRVTGSGYSFSEKKETEKKKKKKGFE